MTKGRNLKAKLKKTYQAKNSAPATDNKPTTVESVSDKINRLRIEHLRASEKPLRQQNLSNKYNNKKQSMGVAGPPPPASWLINNVTNGNNFKDSNNNKKKEYYYYNNGVIDTLCKQCAFQVANSITCHLSVIPDLPVRTRQLILSYCHGLDDTCFLPFVAFDYGDLQLVDSMVTFNQFLKWFWRLDLVQQKEKRQVNEDDENAEEEDNEEEDLLDDWEDGVDLEDKENEDNDDDTDDDDNDLIKFIYDPDNNEVNHTHNRNYRDGNEGRNDDNDDIKDERTFYIEQAIDVLQKKKGKNRGRGNNNTFTKMILSTPLSIKLVSLNISFSKNWPNLTLAHLLIATLPNLKSLGTAGVFSNSVEGPRAISLLSNRLTKLEEWDIGFHDWMTTVDLLFGNSSLIHWNVDLKHLKKFYIRGLDDERAIGEQLALKLKDAGYKLEVIF